MTRTWSRYQQAIFSYIENETGNAIVEAVAGSGKSTTIVEGMNRIPKGASAIFLAFNKAIAEELKARGVNARTFHSLTYSPVTQLKRTHSVTMNKLRDLVTTKCSGEDSVAYGAFMCKLVGLARQAGIGFLVPDTYEAWNDLVEHHDLELEKEGATIRRGIELSWSLLQWSNESPLVDFDDLLYLAVKEGLTLPKFDYVFVDEAQDTNAIQRAILRKILKPTSRIIAVGDPAQAIYGFRGADSDSMQLIADEFNCKSLPLTVSYRCPTAVVKYARNWVRHIEPSETAEVGEVLYKGQDWELSEFVKGDLVICRTTRPLISLAFAFLRARIPSTVLGREIGAGLKALITRLNPRDIEDLERKLDVWCNRECEKAVSRQQDSKVEAIEDKASSIQCLIDGLPEDSRTLHSLYETIDNLFAAGVGGVTLCTIHKAKGLEADRVFWLNRSQCPSKFARQEWQQQQEANLCYVAATRAKKSLVLIEDKKATMS
jgi:DNA helicase II / ATP-dependent DNA helicase PcrA